jgi:hypothetical protein
MNVEVGGYKFFALQDSKEAFAIYYDSGAGWRRVRSQGEIYSAVLSALWQKYGNNDATAVTEATVSSEENG